MLLHANRQRAFACYQIHPNTVILNLDGDDYLAHPQVVDLYADLYKALPQAKIIYGQYRFHGTDRVGHCAAYSIEVKETRDYRKHPWLMSHMRTFRYGLWQNMRPETFTFLAEDQATMYEMAEQCEPEEVVFNPNVTYVYDAYDWGSDYHHLQKSEERIRAFPKRPL